MNSFPEFIEYKANLCKGLNTIIGKIIITPSQLIFRPNLMNVGKKDDSIYEISEIIGYKRGFMAFLSLYFKDGSKIRLAVHNKTAIINDLEARRQALI